MLRFQDCKSDGFWLSKSDGFGFPKSDGSYLWLVTLEKCRILILQKWATGFAKSDRPYLGLVALTLGFWERKSDAFWFVKNGSYLGLVILDAPILGWQEWWNLIFKTEGFASAKVRPYLGLIAFDAPTLGLHKDGFWFGQKRRILPGICHFWRSKFRKANMTDYDIWKLTALDLPNVTDSNSWRIMGPQWKVKVQTLK